MRYELPFAWQAGKQCPDCGLRHKNSACKEVEAFITRQAQEHLSRAVVVQSVERDPSKPEIVGSAGRSSSVTHALLTQARRNAKWRKAHPERHAEQQRAYRARKRSQA